MEGRMQWFIALCISVISVQVSGGERLRVQWDRVDTSFPDDFDTVQLREVGSFHWEKKSFLVSNPSRHVTGYVAYVDDPSRFHFALPSEGCGHRVKTSVTAKQNGCTYATNAGFFDMNTGQCMGNLVINKNEIQLSSDLERVTFGLLGNQVLIGYIQVSSLKRLPPFDELISGAGWLVRESKSIVNVSRVTEHIEDGFVTEKAPRTGLGVLASGQLVVLQVDGIEDEKKGVDLYEFAECFTSLNATQAMNLDGGGSSVSWSASDGIIDYPTCSDTHVKCERAVTSIVCIK
eukprot:scpid84675/ scgid33954/ N-acetylglucosamine-1-phosphodiester alpha-N-acetylglucosaminidase; Mannose 6-phosphate-uncovering enzyme; Phosphodiester alpha-GlcNAcase